MNFYQKILQFFIPVSSLKTFSIKLFLMFFIGSPLAFSQVYFPDVPSKNEPLSIGLQTEYYHTTLNYRFLGQFTDLPKNNYFRYIGFHPSISYSPTSHYINFKIFAQSFNASSRTLTTKRSLPFRPVLIGAGVSMKHKIKSLYFGINLKGAIPLYSQFHVTNSNDLIVGDGSYYIEPGLSFFIQPNPFFYIYYDINFRYRMFSLSGLLFNQIGGVIQTQYADIGLGIDSFYPILSDQYSLTPEIRWDILNKLNGGSYKFYSVNPAVLSFTGWMELKFKPLLINLYFNLDSIGQNYGKGLTLGAITKIKWNTKSYKKKHKIRRFDFENPIETQRDISKKSYFEETEDTYTKKKMNKELKKELKSLRY